MKIRYILSLLTVAHDPKHDALPIFKNSFVFYKQKNLSKREKYEGADWIMHFIGHFKTITRHNSLIIKAQFKTAFCHQDLMSCNRFKVTNKMHNPICSLILLSFIKNFSPRIIC